MESNFVDYVKIMCRSGKGGKGSMHLKHVKYNPNGGPDGGDGGKGGSVLFSPSMEAMAVRTSVMVPTVRMSISMCLVERWSTMPRRANMSAM